MWEQLNGIDRFNLILTEGFLHCGAPHAADRVVTVDLGPDAFPELLSLCVVLGSIGIFLLWLVRLDVRRS